MCTKVKQAARNNSDMKLASIINCKHNRNWTPWVKKLLLILAANPLSRWLWNKERKRRAVWENARHCRDVAFMKNVLNRGWRGLSDASSSAYYEVGLYKLVPFNIKNIKIFRVE